MKDKSRAPKVSFIRRLHSILGHGTSCLHHSVLTLTHYKMAAIAVREQRTSYSSGKKAFQRNLQVENLRSSVKTCLVNSFCHRNIARGHQSGNRQTNYSNSRAHAHRALIILHASTHACTACSHICTLCMVALFSEGNSVLSNHATFPVNMAFQVNVHSPQATAQQGSVNTYSVTT